MVIFDTRTIFYSYLITNIVSTIVVVQLWLQNRKRFEGTSLWLVCCIFQTISLILIALRGEISDWYSIILANTLIVTGLILGLQGLEKFFDQKSNQFYKYIIAGLFVVIHIWFTFIHPNLAIRTLNISLTLLLFFSQYTYLFLYKVGIKKRKLTLALGIIFLIYSLINLGRVINFFISNHSAVDYFQSKEVEAIAVIGYETLFILLIYNIALLYNRRLLMDIADEEEKFSKVFHSSPYGIVLTNVKSSKIIDVNAGFLNITGYRYDEVIGKTTIELQLWNREEDRNKIRNEAFKNGKVIDVELQFRKKTGTIGTVLFSTEIIIFKNEKCSLSSFNDITQRKQMELALRDSESQLRDLNATKDKLFSIFAHDLRSPFNSILGFSTLLKENLRSYDIEKTEQFIGLINSSASHTLILLDDLLAWAKTQTGQMEFKPSNLPLRPIIQEIVKLTATAAKIKNISVSYVQSEEIEIYVDQNMLMTILRNLISNAIKFTNSGGKIDVRAISNPTCTEIIVSDNGVGINEKVKKKLFSLDENYSSTGTANEKGTGLGLLICKEFVEKHGGKIWVESESGIGSDFKFTLPHFNKTDL